jgi:hypothetical protein
VFGARGAETRLKGFLLSLVYVQGIAVIYSVLGVAAALSGAVFGQHMSNPWIVGGIVARAEKAAKIAGRCSVFAKSDMIHAQQKGYTPPEILRGLCDAVARNFKSSITKGKKVVPQVAFIGGATCGSPGSGAGSAPWAQPCWSGNRPSGRPSPAWRPSTAI